MPITSFHTFVLLRGTIIGLYVKWPKECQKRQNWNKTTYHINPIPHDLKNNVTTRPGAFLSNKQVQK